MLPRNFTPPLLLMLSLFSEQLFPAVPGEDTTDLWKTGITEIADFWKTLAFNRNSHLILKNLNIKQFRRISEDKKKVLGSIFYSKHLQLTQNTKKNQDPVKTK